MPADTKDCLANAKVCQGGPRALSRSRSNLVSRSLHGRPRRGKPRAVESSSGPRQGMATIQASTYEQRRTLHREVEFLLARCATLGMAPSEVSALLLNDLQMRVAGKDASTWEAGLPGADLLAQARQAQVCGDSSTWQLRSREWLVQVHGARLGEVIRVEGWQEPREILLDEFVLDWQGEAEMPLSQARMVLTGPSNHLSNGKAVQRSVCSVCAPVQKVARPAVLLQQMYPQRFARGATV